MLWRVTRLGWTSAAPPALASLAGSAFGTLHEKARPRAAIAPLFWDNIPSTLGFSHDSRGKAKSVGQISGSEHRKTPVLALR
ncbi:hypothetical protein FGG78_03215 [Thioclava sp. BHET1]|nr:hypothetical protein FGG78_03215 [Thioclava sp. BHET1]